MGHEATQALAAAEPSMLGAAGNVSACAGFREEEIDLISNYGTRRTFAKGAVIISEGDEALAFYVILSGRAKVYTTTGEGREIILRLLGPGEYFGELTLLDGETRSASVMATEPCNLLVLSRKKFAECWGNYPQIYLKLLKDLSARVRQLTDELKRIASMDVYQRITKLLMDLATRQGDTLIVNQRLTQQDLANRICASREMVNRILQDLVAGGYINFDHRQIVIKKKLPEKW
jgi:CRP/FNR family transcriptional regulator, cyclic AMP receptor protein